MSSDTPKNPVLAGPYTCAQWNEAMSAGAVVGGVVRIASGDQAVIIPEGWKLESLEQFAANPVRKTGRINFVEAASFTDYISLHKGDQTRLFADVKEFGFYAILDHHKAVGEAGSEQAGDAGWGEHIAAYDCPLTEDWQRWMNNDRQPKKQSEFAEFIEDNLPNISQPPGATLLEMCRALSSKTAVSFSSAINLDNGNVQFEYREETTEGAAGPRGQMQVPGMFTLVLAPFVGGKLVAVNGRVRSRIREGHLSLFYILERPRDVLDKTFQEMREEINQKTGLTSLAGMPSDLEE